MKTNYDTDQDGVLSAAEIQAVTSLHITNGRNLKGIEFFSALTNLVLEELNTKDGLDLTQNIHLKSVKFVECSIEEDVSWVRRSAALDMSGLTELKKVIIRAEGFGSSINILNLSGCSALEELTAIPNGEAGLMVDQLILGGCSGLKTLDLRATAGFSTVDLSDCAALEFLRITDNISLRTLDVSHCTALEQLISINNDALAAIDITNCPRLVAVVESNDAELHETSETVYSEYSYDQMSEPSQDEPSLDGASPKKASWKDDKVCFDVTSTLKIKGKKVTTAPTVKSVKNVASGIKTTWQEVSGTPRYQVLRRTGNGKWKVIAVVSGSSYVDTTAKAGTKYTYTVRCVKKDGKTTISGYSAGKSIVRPPKATKLTSVKNTAAKKATVKWKKVSKVTGYQIQYSTSKKFPAKTSKMVTVKGVKNVSKVISKLTKGKTYYIRVRTYQTVSKTKYYSAWSAAKKVKIAK